MRKVSHIVAGLLIGALLLSGCSGPSVLEQENAALTDQVQALSAQLELLGSSVLERWSLAPSPDGFTGENISVIFSAVPKAYLPEKTAELVVTLQGSISQRVPCLWDGTAYTAYLSLLPVDGYGYYLLLSDTDGQTVQLCLSTPELPANPAATDLATTFAPSSAQLVVEDWQAADGVLTVRAGTGTVRMPLLDSAGQRVTCTQAQLVLTRGSVSLGSANLALAPGETQSSCYALIQDATFPLPPLEPEEQLDLWLIAFLSTGETLTSDAVSWYPAGDSLELAVG